MTIRQFFKKIDWPLFLPAVFLSILGLVSIYSSSLNTADFLDFKKQIAFFGFSLILAIVVNFLDLRSLKVNSRLVFTLYLFSLISLAGLLVFAFQTRGIKGWYKIGGISFDPVPIAAIILIIVLAKYFSQRHVGLKRFRPIISSSLYLAIPVFLIILQPDLGSALTLLALWLGVVIFSGIRLRHFFALSAIFLLLFCLAWQFWLADYHKQRIFSFFDLEFEPQGISWSVIQSKIAIGSGGLLGKGLGQGSQTQYGFLSEPKTDFIFSAIAEEFGIVGVFFVLGSLIFLFFQIIRSAFLASNNFSRLFAQGFAFLLLAQSFINIGMCLGLSPVVGVPLPFVSYGGSQLVGFYLGLGILMSLGRS